MNILKGIVFSTVLIAGSVNAAPILFTYTGAVTSVSGAGLEGLFSIGDLATIQVVSDNGGSSLSSQTWGVDDTVSATFSAGGYSLTHTDGWFTAGATGFVTDAGGSLISTEWFGIATDATAFDTFGAGGDLNNGSGLASTGESFGYTPDLATVDAWSVSGASVPEPEMLTLLGLSLLGLGLRRRKLFS